MPSTTLTKDKKEKANRQRFSQNSIVKIRNSSNVSTQHKDVARMLSQFYRNLPDTLIKNLPAVKKMNQNEMNVYVQKQFNLIKNQRVDSNNSNNGKVVTKLQMDINKLHDFFLFLWLDMRHDFKTGDQALKDDFDKFLKGSIVDQFKKDRTWGWDREPIDTDNMKRCREYGIIGTKDKRGVEKKYAYPGDNADKHLKKFFTDMWERENSTIGRIEVQKEANGKYYENLRKDDKSIYISFDSENSRFLSGFIKSSKTQGTRANGTQGDSYLLKRLYTLANLMDPGRLGGSYATPASSIDEVFSRLFNKNPSWAFKINAQLYTWNFGEYFTIEIFQEGRTEFKCKLNNQVLNLGITKAQAASNKGTGNSAAIAKISKTFGDLNQILTVSTLRKSNKRVVSGTQDRAFIGMTGFIQRDLFDIKPQIISDATRAGQDYIVLFGMEDYYKNNVVRTRTGANSVVPTPKKSPSTGQNRAQPSISAASVGSVSGSNRNTTSTANSQSSGSRPSPPPRRVRNNIPSTLGKRKRNNTNNQSNAPAPKRREITSNSQLRINNLRKFINNIDRKLPGANSKVSNRLRTNNYVNNLKSKNTDKNLNLIKDRVFKNAELLATKNKFKKRVMNNLTNLSENNKNKSIKLINGSRSVNNLVNVIGPTINRFRNTGSQPMIANRNKLLRNLKKKNLRNFVVNGLMKSYDNKTKTANQIIREANNFGKTIAAGITAQRLGTLRPKPGGRG